MLQGNIYTRACTRLLFAAMKGRKIIKLFDSSGGMGGFIPTPSVLTASDQRTSDGMGLEPCPPCLPPLLLATQDWRRCCGIVRRRLSLRRPRDAPRGLLGGGKAAQGVYTEAADRAAAAALHRTERDGWGQVLQLKLAQTEGLTLRTAPTTRPATRTL